MTNQELEQNFFAEFGRAVSRWQIVEIHLFKIFARLMRCADGGSASVAFHAVANFRAKLSMVDGIAKYSFPTKIPEMAAWEALNKRAIARSKRRNMQADFEKVQHPLTGATPEACWRRQCAVRKPDGHGGVAG